MRYLLASIALVLASAAGAQQVIPVYQYPSQGTPPFMPLQCDVNYQNCKPYSTANPLPVAVVSGGGGGGGGGGAVTVADGADTSEGATTSAVYTDATGAANGTVNGELKGLFVNTSGLFKAGQGVVVNSGTVTANLGTLNGAATAGNQSTQITAEQAIQQQIGATTSPAAGTTNAQLVTIATNTTGGAKDATLTGGGQKAQAMGITSGGAQIQLLTSTLGVLAAPTAGTAQSTGTVTSIAANTSTTVCPATTNPVVYEVQIYGAAPVLLGLDGQALTAVTPAAGSGAYMLLPTQYTLYSGPVARTNAITAYTGTAMTVVCNIVTRQ